MAKVVMTRYEYNIENRLVFPECPFAGEDPKYKSLEVICSRPTIKEHYCSSMNEKGVCPFDAEHPSTKGGAR